MTKAHRHLAVMATIGVSLCAAAQAGAAERNAYSQTNLVSNGTISAAVTDPKLLNAWGMVFPPGGPFWVSDNGSGFATLYDGAGAKNPLEVEIPPPGGSPAGTTAAPTGTVWNGTQQFLVPGTTLPSAFIFATEDGTISGWSSSLPDRTHAVLAVDNSQGGQGAVYKGLALGTNAKGTFLFATDFRGGKIDVWNGSFQPATLDGSFTDAGLPAGFAPFGIRNVDGDLFVTFAKQNAEKHDDVAGPGNGFVDIFDTDGHLLRRFASGGTLNSPWGVTRTSFAFGAFSGDILVGNFGDGRINAFDSAGDVLGQLNDSGGNAITIDGLWSLVFGGGANSSPDDLYFTAGPNQEQDGLFGKLTPLDGTNTATSAQSTAASATTQATATSTATQTTAASAATTQTMSGTPATQTMPGTSATQ